MTSIGSVKASAAALLVLALGACSGPAGDDSVETDANLLVGDNDLSDVASVSPDRLEVPRRGHEGLLSLPAGKVIAGKRSRSGVTDNGFLRKVVSVESVGDTIVIHTVPAALTDAIANGNVLTHFSSDDALATQPGTAASTLKVQTIGQALKNTNFTGAVIFAEKEVLGGTGALSSTGVTVHENVTVAEGAFSFSPSFDTGLQIRRSSLERFHLLTTADLNVKFVLDVDVHADVDIEADLYKELKPQKSKKRLFSIPRFRLPPQFIGVLPVYEAVEISVDFGCDFHFKGAVHLKTGMELGAHLAVGAAYEKGGKWHRLGDEPQVKMTPIFDPGLTGNLSITCYIEPEVSFLFYDIAGPYIGVGPYLDTEIAKSASGVEYGLYPGLSGELGGDLTLFDRDVTFGSFPLFDVQAKKPILASANPPTPQ